MGGKEKTGKQKVKGWGKSFRKYRKQAGKVGQSLVEKETVTPRKHDDCPLGADGTLPVNEVITANCFAEIVRNTYIGKV